MATSDFLQSLINSGPDAQSNLYRATFTFASDNSGFKKTEVDGLIKPENLGVRLTKYNSPLVAIQTASLAYQNISINIPVVSSTLENKLSLSFRMDDGYNLYKLLKKCLPLSSQGTWGPQNERGESESNFTPYVWSSVKVEAYSGGKSDVDKGYMRATALSWEYHDCKLLDIPSLSYAYGGSQALEVTCNFVYSYCATEEPSSSENIQF